MPKEKYEKPSMEIIALTRSAVLTSMGGGHYCTPIDTNNECLAHTDCVGHSGGIDMCSALGDPHTCEDCPDDGCFSYGGQGMCSGYENPSCNPFEGGTP